MSNVQTNEITSGFLTEPDAIQMFESFDFFLKQFWPLFLANKLWLLKAGQKGGEQTISLKISGCFSRGTIVHEFMHALGSYN